MLFFLRRIGNTLLGLTTFKLARVVLDGRVVGHVLVGCFWPLTGVFTPPLPIGKKTRGIFRGPQWVKERWSEVTILIY